MSPTTTAIIIQARMSSTRLPGKVLRPFYQEWTILDIIVERLRQATHKLPICIATSVSEKDDAVVAFAQKADVFCFRGSEDDVLGRFIGAAKEMNATQVVRVCADNPFLDPELMDELFVQAQETQADYHSFLVDENLPAIRSHWGIFTEIATLPALEKAARLTSEKFYHEHVTNFIYGTPEQFRCQWKKAPPSIYGRTDVRFTIDTPEDFALMQRLWTVLAERGIPANFRHALQLLEEFPELRSAMQEQIRANSK